MTTEFKSRAKRLGEVLSKRVSLRLAIWHIRRARLLGGGNISDGIRYAIESAKDRIKK